MRAEAAGRWNNHRVGAIGGRRSYTREAEVAKNCEFVLTAFQIRIDLKGEIS